jgi:DNA-binding MarR family transcriptional regulator
MSTGWANSNIVWMVTATRRALLGHDGAGADMVTAKIISSEMISLATFSRSTTLVTVTSTDDGRARQDGDTGYEIGFLLRAAHVRAASVFNAALEPLGIEGRHFAVLDHLDRHSYSQRQLADLTGSDKSTMGRLIDDLESKGLASRQPSPGDRRVYTIALTSSGTRTLAMARQTARAVAARLLDHMSAQDQRGLTGLLQAFLRGQ